jgi:hypothetical protein
MFITCNEIVDVLGINLMWGDTPVAGRASRPHPNLVGEGQDGNTNLHLRGLPAR